MSELANDEAITRIVARGTETAIAEGHSVHVEVPNLRPGREYFYRFHANGQASAVGRTRTAPRRGESPESLRLCLASCSNCGGSSRSSSRPTTTRSRTTTPA